MEQHRKVARESISCIICMLMTGALVSVMPIVLIDELSTILFTLTILWLVILVLCLITYDMNAYALAVRKKDGRAMLLATTVDREKDQAMARREGAVVCTHDDEFFENLSNEVRLLRIDILTLHPQSDYKVSETARLSEEIEKLKKKEETEGVNEDPVGDVSDMEDIRVYE